MKNIRSAAACLIAISAASFGLSSYAAPQKTEDVQAARQQLNADRAAGASRAVIHADRKDLGDARRDARSDARQEHQMQREKHSAEHPARTK